MGAEGAAPFSGSRTLRCGAYRTTVRSTIDRMSPPDPGVMPVAQVTFQLKDMAISLESRTEPVNSGACRIAVAHVAKWQAVRRMDFQASVYLSKETHH
jgi:hypothetical protein